VDEGEDERMTTHDAAPHGRGMAWATLLVAGTISLGVNLWHAFDQADGQVTVWFGALAVMYGTAPVVLAAFQSHSAAFTPKGWFRLTLTYALMLLGMALSIRAQAAAVEPFAGRGWRWVFPVMVDLSTIEALITLVISARRTAAATSTGVPEQAPVRRPVRDTEPVPVRAAVPPAVPAAPVEPVPAPVPPAVPVQTAGPERAVPAPVPAPDRTAEPAPDRPGTADLTSAKAGDAAALEQMDRAFADQDPAGVSVRQVRKELGAGHARADRLLALWVARAGADRGGSERPGTGVDGADRGDGSDGEGEPDRTADRVTVPA
jgi:hypothetical protein